MHVTQVTHTAQHSAPVHQTEKRHAHEQGAQTLEGLPVTAFSSLDHPLSGELPPSAIRTRAGLIQPKLVLGTPDDAFEREADAVADQVVRAAKESTAMPWITSAPLENKLTDPGSHASTGGRETIASLPPVQPRRLAIDGNIAQRKCKECENLQQEETEEAGEANSLLSRKEFDPGVDEGGKPTSIQRKCARCEKEDALHLQPKTANIQLPHGRFESQLRNQAGLGRALPLHLQAQLGHHLGADLGNIRIHTDAPAASLARDINARAFTQGENIYFGEGEFQPETTEGLRLLAHEVTHTLQQGAAHAHRPLTHMVADATIQRTCRNLPAEFEHWDPDHLSPADRRRLDRRIRECALSDLETFRTRIASLPASPRDLDAGFAARYDRMTAVLDAQDSILGDHADSITKTALQGYLQAIRSALTSNKPFAYWAVWSDGSVTSITRTIEHNVALVDNTDTQLHRDLRDETSLIAHNPERIVLRDRTHQYYQVLGVRRLTVTDGGIASDPNADPLDVPNMPAYPASMTGPQTMVKNGTGVYTLSLDYSVAGADLLSQVAAAMNHVGYTWELYDITTVFRERIRRQSAAIRAAATSGTPPPATTDADIAVDQAVTQRPDEAAESGVLDAAGRRWERFGTASLQEMEDNWEDFTNPQAGSDGSFIGDVATSFIGEFNLATTAISTVFGALSELISTVADLFGGVTNEKEIAFPNREGWFLVRCIASPSRSGTDEDPIIYASSVANMIVRVRDIHAFTQDQRTDIDASLQAREMELQALLLQTTDPADRARLEADLAAVRVEQNGTAVEILRGRITQMEALRDRTTDAGQRRILERRIEELRLSLETATAREGEFREGTIIRPRAVFVSEEYGSTYPLLLQLGLMSERGGTFRYRLSDISRKDGDTYEGYGSSPGQAAHRAIGQFARSAPYGRGLLNIVLPDGTPFTLPQAEYECRARGGTLALQRLEEVATVLTILGLLAVPYAGEVALVIGAGMAAHRIYQRIENHTFRWDTEAFTDVVTLLGAAASGASAIGRMRVVRTARLFAVVSDDADVVRLIATMNRTASRLELLEDFINWGGYMLGSITTLGQLADISASEMAGSITHAEARRQRAALMLAAVRDGIFQFAGFNPNETARRIHDSVAPLPGDGAAPAHGRESAAVPATPERPPGTTPSAEGPLPATGGPEGTPRESTERPGDATVPSPRLRLPDTTVESNLATLRSHVGEIPFALEQLLRHDHELLQRAATDASVITAENLRAWTEIGRLAPMHPDSYPLLLANEGLRQALVQNPAAQAALKHCASPCFPTNASADDIQALQALLLERAAQNLPTDMRALNDFLYAHRGEADLGEIIARLRADYAQTMQTLGSTALVYPAGWQPGGPDRPGLLQSVVEKFAAQNLPNGLLNGIMAGLAGHPEAGSIIGSLNIAMSARGRDSNPLHLDRVLYALADPATRDMGLILLSRAAHAQSLPILRGILTRINVPELASLHPAHFDLSKPEDFDHLQTITTRTDLTTAAAIIDLINHAGYPPAAPGAIHPDLGRLVDLLLRNPEGTRLTSAQIRAQIEALNQSRLAAEQGNYTLPLVQGDVRNSGNSRGQIVGDLLSYLHHILIVGDNSAALADSIGGAAFGQQLMSGTADFATFVGATDILRSQYQTFVEQLVTARRGTAPSSAELTAIINSTWNPKRGDFFELVAQRSLLQAFGAGNALGEYRINFPGGHSFPDSTVLQSNPPILRIVFFEFKTGANTRSPDQAALQSLVESGAADLASQLNFGPGALGRQIETAIRDAQRAGHTIQFAYILIQENP